MPVFKIETKDGAFEIEAPDENAALNAFKRHVMGGGQQQADPFGSSAFDAVAAKQQAGEPGALRQGVLSGEIMDSGRPQPEAGVGADMASQFGRNFNKGLYATLNAPTAIANLISQGVGSDFRFKRPLEAAVPSADEAIMQVPDAQTSAGRYAGTVGEYVGANALPAGGMIAAAPRIAAATAGSTGLAGQAANRMATGIANAPAVAAGGELAATIGAGTGAQVARDVAPGSGLGEFVGATLGGMAPSMLAVTPARLAAKGIKSGVDKMSPKAVERRNKAVISKAIGDNLTAKSLENIAKTEKVQKLAPGYSPSVAEATRNPSLIETQRAFESGLSGPDLDAAIARYEANADALGMAARSNRPQSGVDLDGAISATGRRVQDVRNKISSSMDDVAQKEVRLASGVRSGDRRRNLGGTIREELLTNKSAMKEDMATLASRYGLNDETQRFRFDKGVKDELASAVELRSAGADSSMRPNAIIADIRAMGDSASIVDFVEIRSRIGDEIRANLARPDGAKRVQYLQALQSRLDDVADTVIREAGADEIADNWAAFRRIYRDEYVQNFKQGAAGRVLKKGVGGEYRIPDEDVAKEFFDKWNETASAQFNRVFNEESQARSAMEAVALDDLHSFAVRDGVFNPSLVEAWARGKAGVLQDFPDISAKVSDIQKAIGAISARRASLVRRQKNVERSFLAREISKIETLSVGGTPEALVDRAMRTPNMMMKLRGGLKTEEAKKALAAHVWDSALKSSKPLAYLDEHKSAAKIALGKHYKTARLLANAIENNNVVQRPKGAAIDTNPVAGVEGFLGTGLNQLSSRIFAVKSGRTSSRYALADVAGRAFRSMTGEQARETLQQALYDPKVAIELANTFYGKQPSPITMNRLFTFFVSNGLVAATNEQERQPQ